MGANLEAGFIKRVSEDVVALVGGFFVFYSAWWLMYNHSHFGRDTHRAWLDWFFGPWYHVTGAHIIGWLYHYIGYDYYRDCDADFEDCMDNFFGSTHECNKVRFDCIYRNRQAGYDEHGLPLDN